ncbi:MAG: GLUG motif-containing protein, partial [Clostridia bacterium]
MKARYFFLVCFSCMIATLLCGITSLYSTQNEIQVAYASDLLGYVAISTPEDLANIDNDKFGKYYLKNDINLAGRMWKPIADFRGVLDGQGHSISTIVFESGRNLEEGIGLFANTFKEAEIKNVSINNATIFAHDIVGVVNCGFIAGKNLGAITNCNVKGNIKAVSSLNSNKSDLSVGGIVGKNDHGTISDCNVQGSINAESFLNCVAGGIVGRNEYGTIENCYADVDICSKSQKSEACAMGTSGKSNGALKESRNISFGKKQAQSAPSFAENNGNDMPLSIKSKDNTSISIETGITNVPLYSTIIVNNDNWFDDKKSIASLAINGAGYYSVCLYNSLGQKYAYELKLLVSPIINGIEDEGLYYGSVEPQIEGGEELLLDGKPYVGGAINTCGNHTLEVLGLGNYKRTINFVVEPTINNIEDHKIYKLGVAPIIGGGEL